MKIKREQLLESIFQFSIDGSGMIVGKPGIGKSYLLRQLKKRLQINDILSFIIKIDNTFDASDEAIENELGIEREWISTLNQIKLRNEHKAVLIFDAFDAARDEEKRRGFLTQIKKAKNLLKNKWNVIVSVRTYDASKSEELIRLFSSNEVDGNSSHGRKIEITELLDQEITEALTDSPKLLEFYINSNKELKEILHVPFFLNLLNIIIEQSSDNEINQIKKFKSQTQLLTLFWQQKVVNTNRHVFKEKLLSNLTFQLVQSKSLSYSKLSFLKSAERSDVEVFDYLRSENILDEVALNNSRIAYSHNILFDFAVSWYCISENYEELVKFINEDVSRPFFFRPSFVYFFTSLWYENNSDFWSIYEKLITNQQKEFQLFVRLILNGTIASEFSSVEDLKSILDVQNSNSRSESVKNLLQSIRFIRNKSNNQDIDFLKYLSIHLEVTYLFEFGYLLNRAVNDSTKEYLNDCGIIARNFLSFVLQNRNTKAKTFIDRIGASRGIELVAKTYNSNIPESAKILSSIFEIIKESEFEISYFTFLSEHIKHILPYDPQFVAKVYQVIFEYTETSNKQTDMGGGSVILNFTSNRRQDFEMCYFRLQQFFPQFISASPNIAIQTGLLIVNRLIETKRTFNSINQPSIFFFKQNKVVLIPDMSTIWADSHYLDKGLEIAIHIISYVEALLNKKKIEEALNLINLYISFAQVGFLWKILFKLIAKFPDILFNEFFDLIIIPQLFGANDTAFEIRDIIEKARHIITNDQIKSVETAIFSTYSEDRNYAIQATLSILPIERLQLSESIKFMQGKDIISNKPAYSSSFSSSTLTTEDWLQDRGLDLTDPQNLKLTNLTQKFDVFNSQYLNITPDYIIYSELLAVANETFVAIVNDDKIDPDLFYTILTSLTRTISICSKNLNGISKNDFEIIKKIIDYSFNYISPFENNDDDASPASGYSPTPRIEASSALINVFIFSEDEKFLNEIKVGVNDKNGVVRFSTIRQLPLLFKNFYQEFYTILYERLEQENDSFIYSSLLSILHFKNETIIADAKKVIKIANSKQNLFLYHNSFVEAYADFLLWTLKYPEIEDGFVTMFNAYQYPELCNALIFSLFKQVSISFSLEGINFDNFEFDKKLKIIANYISQAGKEFVDINDSLDLENPRYKNAIQVIDQVILRLFFSIEPRNKNQFKTENPSWDDIRKKFYFKIKPIYHDIILISGKITKKGFIVGHTAHYFMQSLNILLNYDAKDILVMVSQISNYAVQAGYTFDSSAMIEIVKLTEKLFADHRELLLNAVSFNELLSILEIYINSGWNDALELLWKLDEIFK